MSRSRTKTVSYAEKHVTNVPVMRIVPENSGHMPLYFMAQTVATFEGTEGEAKGTVDLTSKHVVVGFEWEGRRYQYRMEIEKLVNQCLDDAKAETAAEKAKAQNLIAWNEMRDAAHVLFKTFEWRESGGSGPTRPLFTKSPTTGNRIQPYIEIEINDGCVKFSTQQEAYSSDKTRFPLTIGGITDAINLWEKRDWLEGVQT